MQSFLSLRGLAGTLGAAVALAAVPLHAQDLTTGLMACYPMEGNANDASGTGRHGTVSGATLTTNRLGNPNSAYLFDGTNAIYNSFTFAGYSSFTIACWARIAPSSSTSEMLVQTASGALIYNPTQHRFELELP